MRGRRTSLAHHLSCDRASAGFHQNKDQIVDRYGEMEARAACFSRESLQPIR